MSQLSLPEIQSKLDLLLDSGKTIIALKAADPNDYPSIIDEFYQTHNIASDDEIINRMDEVAGMISKAFECSSAAKSILDMGPVLDSYLKNQETKKIQKKKPNQPSVSAAIEPTESTEPTEPIVKAKVTTAKKAKSTQPPTSMKSLKLKPSAAKILKLFVDGRKMDLIKDVSGFTESDVYQNFTSDYWKKIEDEWSPEAIKLVTTINLTNCSLPKNVLFGVNTMLDDQNVAISAGKFDTLGYDPTYEDTVLYQAIQDALNKTPKPKRGSGKSTSSRRKTAEQETPVVVQRDAPKVIEAPNAPVIPAPSQRRRTDVEITPETQDDNVDDYATLNPEVIKIEEFDSMDDQIDEPVGCSVEQPNNDLIDPVEEPNEPIEQIEEPIEEPVKEAIEPNDDQNVPVESTATVRAPRSSRAIRTTTTSIGISSTRRRTSGIAQSSTRVTRSNH